jgi:histidine ammonia-lyase
VIDVLHAEVGGPGPDRFLAPDIEAAVALVRAGRIRAAAESVTGTLR